MGGPISDMINEKFHARKNVDVKYRVPAKPPPRGKHWSNLWWGYSPKIDREVVMYSDLEYYNWIKIESETNVLTFCEQPLYMEILSEGRPRRSLVDMWLLYENGSEQYREVKLQEDLDNKDIKVEVKEQIYVQETWCKLNRKEHFIMTDLKLAEFETVIDNWSQILSVLQHTKGLDFRKSMSKVLSVSLEDGPQQIWTVAEAVKGDVKPFDIIPSIYLLLHLGLLKFSNPNEKLSTLSMLEFIDVQS